MIVQTLKEHMKEAMKARETVRLTTIRGLLSAFVNYQVDNGATPQDEISDENASKVIKTEVKRRRDSINQFSEAGRSDLADNEKEELDILLQYLPEQMNEEQIKAVVERLISELEISGKSDIGKLMPSVMKECSNADGSLVKQIVDSLLA
jgi:uncharacterized protein